MKGHGHGKVILVGEHAVVYGKPAIAASLARGVRAEASEGEEDLLRIPAWELEVRPDAGAEEPLPRAFAHALVGLPAGRRRFVVEAWPELPSGAGLGCSAALGVAVLEALGASAGAPSTRAELVSSAFAWEQEFHGQPSGIDNTVAALGGVVWYQRGAPLERLVPRHPVNLVVAHSGEFSSTKVTVARVARQLERRPEETRACLDAIETIVRNARVALEQGHLADLGRLFDLNQMMLSSLMLSTERLERLCERARSAGALGAKLTGGGGGGCMIALVADGGEAVSDALAAEGAEPFTVEVRA